MQIRVLFFGVLKDVMGRSVDEVSLPAGATLADLMVRYQAEMPRLRQWAASLALSVNQQYAAPDTALSDQDEVALLPPVSGGGANPYDDAERCGIVREKIDTHYIVPPLEQPADGAIVMFDGIVRDHSRGRRTLHLEYEAYEAMALAEMKRLRAQALAQFAIRDAALYHRLGRIEIGESSVFIAVVAAHRAPAFEACRWLIDTLKRTVPIWKKEFFADDAVWADGEPFPPAVAATPHPAHASEKASAKK